jgi:FMN-dependent NADH-azoreductase
MGSPENEQEWSMNRILQINSSLHGAQGESSRLATAFAAVLQQRTGAALTVRDLAENPVPHLDAARFAAFIAKPEQRTPEQQAVAAYSDALIEELRHADVIVLGLPMYNFSLPSSLKAYFDHIARAGITFRYTEKGPEGLLKNKKVYVFAARGGAYVGTPADSQTAYVRHFLGFLGMTDVEFVYAEGLAMGETPRQQSLSQARDTIAALAPALVAAA